MRNSFLACALTLVTLLASPAAAQTTFNFATGPNSGQAVSGNLNFSSANPSLGVSVRAYTFTDSVAPATLHLTNLSGLASGAAVSWSNRGIGVCTENGSLTGNGNQDGCAEVDTSNGHQGKKTNPTPNEALLLDFTGSAGFNITSAVLNMVDTNDTLGVFGVSETGVLNFLGFANDPLANGAAGGNGFTGTYQPHVLGGTYSMTFNPALGGRAGYNRYIFTAGTNGQDGYRMQSITAVSAVPEPATWAMLLFGFGFIGFQMRRSRGRVSLGFEGKGSTALTN